MGKNDLLLRTLNGEETERTPVWMMRQAGRYMWQYRELREKHSFFECCQTPELAKAITLMPVNEFGVDAAILFSDILVVLQAMGLEVLMLEEKGPMLPKPIKDISDLNRIHLPNVEDSLGYVFEAIRLTQKELDKKVPLIGFAGAPWTLFCYMVEGKGSKTWDKAKAFCFAQPKLAHILLDMVTDTTIAYLKGQIAAGADTVQLFDSWAGVWGKNDFAIFCLPYIRKIVEAIQPLAPVIVFAKGAWHSLGELSNTGASALGIDYCVDADFARKAVGNKIVLQGNLDPAKLLAPKEDVIVWTTQMLEAFGGKRHIANLGHGILPNVPVENAIAFIETVKNWKKK